MNKLISYMFYGLEKSAQNTPEPPQAPEFSDLTSRVKKITADSSPSSTSSDISPVLSAVQVKRSPNTEVDDLTSKVQQLVMNSPLSPSPPKPKVFYATSKFEYLRRAHDLMLELEKDPFQLEPQMEPRASFLSLQNEPEATT